jgi:hypothetical protein
MKRTLLSHYCGRRGRSQPLGAGVVLRPVNRTRHVRIRGRIPATADSGNPKGSRPTGWKAHYAGSRGIRRPASDTAQRAVTGSGYRQYENIAMLLRETTK